MCARPVVYVGSVFVRVRMLVHRCSWIDVKSMRFQLIPYSSSPGWTTIGLDAYTILHNSLVGYFGSALNLMDVRKGYRSLVLVMCCLSAK